MELLAAGVDYNTPISIREKAAYTATKLEKAANWLIQAGTKEFYILSTCNRSEVYALAEEKELLCRFFREIHGIEPSMAFEGTAAVRHLFETATGLHSLVLGEDQILGQIKTAHYLAMERKWTGPVLNRVISMAVHSAKRVKTETRLSRNHLSVSGVAVSLLESLWGEELPSKKALIIGNGKTGHLTAHALFTKGVRAIWMTNRLHRHGGETLPPVAGTLVSYDQRYDWMEQADVVLSCTSSPHYTVCGEACPKGERVYLDLAVPRDVDPLVGEMEGATLYTIDDLTAVSRRNWEEREKEAQKARAILEQELEKAEEWLRSLDLIQAKGEMGRFEQSFIRSQAAYAARRLRLEEKEQAKLEKILAHSVHACLGPLLEAGDKDLLEKVLRAVTKEN